MKRSPSSRPWMLAGLLAATACAHAAAPTAAPANAPTAADAAWPRARHAIAPDATLEARVERILASMSLAQKVGQMTQPEIKHITPDEVRRYAIGSVLNGGGSWPGNRKNASAAEWLALAQAYHAASLATGLPDPVPVIWGTDAVHGHNNLVGATLYPHNIGLGATRNPALVRAIGAATARAVRATGIQWVFAPTLAVVQDDRWGRTYESFGEDPALVRRLGKAHVAGLQGDLARTRSLGPDRVLATAKHYIGDGGTAKGKDQGLTEVSADGLRRLHAEGYYGAFEAGAQTVMASFNSWTDATTGSAHGKLHGSFELLTRRLKQQMGFDGLVVSDWNGIGQIPGCSNDQCAAALNAGIDLVMVPEAWKAFIANTIAQVQRGEVPLARIDDAVRRILRVKLRAGLFDLPPEASPHAGQDAALRDRALARRAVRESLVLLKNEGGLLPLARTQRVLVVGKSADRIDHQSGGWSITWQGTDTTPADFPHGQSVLAALREALGAERVHHSPDGRGVDPAQFDTVIAVLGETPYAEGNGDIPPSGTLQHTRRHPEDLAVLNAVAGLGKPVVSVFLSGRPLWVNDLLNRSQAFVAAWLPGTEGGGVADLLLRDARGRVAHPFTGRLPFAWPIRPCQTPLNSALAGRPATGGTPLFATGFGLGVGARGPRGAQAQPKPTALDETLPQGGCEARDRMVIFERTAQVPYELLVVSPTQAWPTQKLSDDLNATLHFPASGEAALQVQTVQLNTQQDAKRLAWRGRAQLVAWSAQRATLSAYPNASLDFDLALPQAPAAGQSLRLGMDGKALDLAPWLRGLAQPTAGAGAAASPDLRVRVQVPLSCFAALGVNLAQVEMPFQLEASSPFTASVAALQVVAEGARQPGALACSQLPAAAAL